MKSEDDLNAQIKDMIKKANRSLNASKQHIESGDYDFASSRAYYTVFYAMEATLLTKNLSFSKHGGVIASFNQHFVKIGIFPKEFSKWVARLFRERQTGDYLFELSIEKKDADEDVNISEQILTAIEEHLKSEKFLS